jgi:hypothetical protein
MVRVVVIDGRTRVSFSLGQDDRLRPSNAHVRESGAQPLALPCTNKEEGDDGFFAKRFGGF